MELSAFIRIYILFGAFFLFLLSTGELLRRQRTALNYLLALFGFSLAGILVGHANLDQSLQLTVPSLHLFDTWAIYALGPCMYLGIREVTGSLPRRWYFHFVLPALAFLANIPVLFSLTVENDAHGYLVRPLTWLDHMTPGELVYFSGVVFAVFYTVLCLVIVLRSKLVTRKLLGAHSTGLAYLLILVPSFSAGILALAAMLFEEFLFLRLSAVAITTGALAWHLANRRYPSLYNSLIDAVRHADRYRKTQLTGVNLDEIAARVTGLFEEEKIYRQDDLNLSRVAGLVGLSVNQFSEFLNSHWQKNFSALVGEYRTREALQLLHDTDLSITRIAFDVGYSSLSAFNRGFKKIHGYPPSQARRENSMA